MKAASGQYICINCGYVYTPADGDAMNAIPPNTDFVDLPEEWVCPICYASCDFFDAFD